MIKIRLLSWRQYESGAQFFILTPQNRLYSAECGGNMDHSSSRSYCGEKKNYICFQRLVEDSFDTGEANEKASQSGQEGLFCFFERKTRLELAAAPWAFSRKRYPPATAVACPQRGHGVARASLSITPEKPKSSQMAAFQLSERKTRLELATPTLARSCSTN